MDKRPIGIFDSGVGGLTVVREILRQLPDENIIYFGDTARVPYGTKSAETVTRYSLEIADFLLSKNVKSIVVACNTASALALDALKKKYPLPIPGVINPAVAKAVAATKSKKIAVIGTEATISSKAYQNEIKKRSGSVSVYAKSCPLLVSLVEEGWLNNKITMDVLRIYLKEIVSKKIDTLILGCTHYPLLKNAIAKTVGRNIKIIDSASSVVSELKELFASAELLSNDKNPKKIFYVSDSPERFRKIGERFLKTKFNDNIKKITL